MENNIFTLSELVNLCVKSTPTQDSVLSNAIFSSALATISKFDFRLIKLEEYFLLGRQDELKKRKKDKTDKDSSNDSEYELPTISTDEKCVYISRILSGAIQRANSDFIMMFGDPYYYTGELWEKIPENHAVELITLAARKTGMLVSECNREDFKRRLFKQLISDFPIPDEDKDLSELKILINLKNGTLELTEDNFILRDFRKEDMLRYQLDYEYNPEATCPMFDAFLDEVLPEKAAQAVLFEMMAYCFVPTRLMKLERSLMLYGPGANGKGVVFDLVVAILGEEHVSGFSMESLSNDPNARAQLKDVLLNYSTELGGKCNPDMIKKLISGEPVDVKTLYKDKTMMKDYSCKFIFNTNSLPRGAENTNAFFRRWLILPFDVEVPKEHRDIHLSKKLKKELPGIFNRVLQGLKRLIENEDFTDSQLVRNMIEEYKEQTNSVLRFIKDERWVPSVDKSTIEKVDSSIPHQDRKSFYAEYLQYCKESNCTPSSDKDFGRKIKEFFCVQTGRTNNSTWVFAKKEGIPVPDINEFKTSSNNVIDQVINDLKSENNENSNG